ncbi:SH3 and PX domain-containing protein 2A [Protopterus annectens]|uniref:SH3 and PX domain-containing protein 2A n=1 Tax=Protopterus annectens TaxID=7888 RepID=UPI001CF9E87E|nr:SH3 and PX domain-containing protein 2A [Protopterus annectens]
MLTNRPIVSRTDGGCSRGAMAGSWLTACFFPSSGADGNSDPMILEQYVVVANYEKQEISEISLKAGEVVDVIEKNESGWWFVSTAEEQGWVPATYLESQSGTKDDSEISTLKTGEVTKRRKAHLRRLDRRWTLGGIVNRQQSREEKYITVQPYSSQGKDEIGFDKGVTVEVIQKNLEGWWYISLYGHIRANKAKSHQTKSIHIYPYLDDCLIQALSLEEGFQLPKPPEPPAVEVEYYTIAEFQSCISDGISFHGGQKANVIEKNSGGWWYVHIGEQEGWAPASYIDKRKKPNLNRRTSTLTRPKIPPPAPPSKPKDCEEGIQTGASSFSETLQDSPQKLIYEEPEYDVPAVGFDLEPDFDDDIKIYEIVPSQEAMLEKLHLQSPKRPPLNALQRAKFKVGESVEDIAREEETIYENDGFRPFIEDNVSCKGSSKESSGDSDSVKSSSLFTARRSSSPKPVSPKSSVIWNKIETSTLGEISKSSLFSGSEETKPRSSSDANLRGAPKTDTKREMEPKPWQSPSSKAKPLVRPKPLVTKSESQSQDQMDISTLRRQLRPTRQLKNGLKSSKSEESESTLSQGNLEQVSSKSSTDLSPSSSNSLIHSSNQALSTRPEGEKELKCFYRAIESYIKTQDTEISIPCGAEVEVLEKQENGWWFIKYGDSEGWAPSYYLEAVNTQAKILHTEPETSTANKNISDNKSNSLEKIEKKVQALNNINQNLKRATPPIPNKPPGGFTKPTGVVNGPVKLRNGVRQVAVRPQSVFVSPSTKDNNSVSGILRRNESLTSTDQLRTVRRNSSFSTARSQIKQSDKSIVDGLDSSRRSSPRNGIPVSTVRPKLVDKSQFIHNSLKDIYISIADYAGDEETLGFEEGTSMEVLERNPNGWWYCQILEGGQPLKGWVPSNYLEKKN